MMCMRLHRLAILLCLAIRQGGLWVAATSWLHDKDDNEQHIGIAAFVEALQQGQSSTARWLAQEIMVMAGQKKQNHNQPPQHEIQRQLRHLYQETRPRQVDEPSRYMTNDDTPHQVVRARQDEDDCWTWHGGALDLLLPPDLWDTCCSQLHHHPATTTTTQSSHNDDDDTWTAWHNKAPPTNDRHVCFNDQHRRLCCHFRVGSSSYLHLPLLHELALTVQTTPDNNNNFLYHIQQDGFLRLYEPSAILWPTGYLLSLCLAAPHQCGVATLLDRAVAHADKSHAVAVELGAGVGLPSIVLARTLAQSHNDQDVAPWVVLATDKSPAALQLVADNARVNGVASCVAVEALDFAQLYQVQNLTQRHHGDHGFALVLGSSLMALFDVDHHDRDAPSLWQVLDALLARDNPHAVAILAHGTNALPATIAAQNGFVLVHRLPGTHFGMYTRQAMTRRDNDDEHAASDFEISVFARRVPHQDEL